MSSGHAHPTAVPPAGNPVHGSPAPQGHAHDHAHVHDHAHAHGHAHPQPDHRPPAGGDVASRLSPIWWSLPGRLALVGAALVALWVLIGWAIR